MSSSQHSFDTTLASDLAVATSSTMHRMRLVAAGVVLAFAVTACGGGSSSIGAAEAMPSNATDKAREKAEACDEGDLDSCNWVGIWFMVGGAGKERRREGVRYIQHACDEGLDKSCKLMAALRKAANSE